MFTYQITHTRCEVQADGTIQRVRSVIGTDHGKNGVEVLERLLQFIINMDGVEVTEYSIDKDRNEMLVKDVGCFEVKRAKI